MQDKLYIGTNTKMYKTIRQTIDFLNELGRLTEGIDRSMMELFVIPSYTTLDAASKIAHQSSIILGAQNMSWQDEGQLTGEISPVMLKEVGVQVVEIGHSERRHVLGENDEMGNWKLLTALRHGFTPLLCVGETASQKKYGTTDEILRTQLKIGLWNTTSRQAENIWVAYEPVWAIGVDGVPASIEYAKEKHKVIRDTLIEIFGEDAGDRIPILYGGSVNRKNACQLIQTPNIDGLFIGRSAWDATNFSNIIHDVMDIITLRKNKN